MQAAIYVCHAELSVKTASRKDEQQLVHGFNKFSQVWRYQFKGNELSKTAVVLWTVTPHCNKTVTRSCTKDGPVLTPTLNASLTALICLSPPSLEVG